MIWGFKKEKKEKRLVILKNFYEFLFLIYLLRFYIRFLLNVLVYLCFVGFEKKYRFRYLFLIFLKLLI